jgi:hypothetical protein
MGRRKRILTTAAPIILVLVGGVAAAVDFSWFEATADQWGAGGPAGTDALFSQTGFFFNDGANTFRTYGGDDSHNMGDGMDHYSMGNGSDNISLGGAGLTGGDIITFDYAGNSLPNGYANSKHYIKSSYMPDFVPPTAAATLEVRSNNVTVSSNLTGDVVIKLGLP